MGSLRERTSGTSEKQAALAALYETHFERVSRYISVRIGDFSEAEGLASEVFSKPVKAARPTTIGGRLWRHGYSRSPTTLLLTTCEKEPMPASDPIDEAFSLTGPQDPQKPIASVSETRYDQEPSAGLESTRL